MKIQPTGDNVLIKRDPPPENKSKGGLHLPDSAKSKSYKGTVVNIGPGRVTRAGTIRTVDIPIGARVIFGQFSGSAISEDADEQYMILSQDDIIAIIEEKK